MEFNSPIRQKPIVSIIIPTYNTAHYLIDSITSVLFSRDVDYELIVIDDGSIDDTEIIIRPFLSNKKIKYIKQINMGLAGARNTGILHSDGKYLVFLDSDDIIDPLKLGKQLNFLEANSQFDVVYSKSKFFFDGNPTIEFDTNFPTYSGEIFQKLLFGNFIHINSAMVRRKIIINAGLFDESLRELEDWDLWLRLSINGSKFGYINEVLSKVRVRKDSMTVNQKRMNEGMVRVLRKLQLHLMTKGVFDEYKTNYYYAYHLFLLQANMKKGYLFSLLKAFQSSGLVFTKVFAKLFLKYLLSSLLKFKNNTTRQLEAAWNK